MTKEEFIRVMQAEGVDFDHVHAKTLGLAQTLLDSDLSEYECVAAARLLFHALVHGADDKSRCDRVVAAVDGAGAVTSRELNN